MARMRRADKNRELLLKHKMLVDTASNEDWCNIFENTNAIRIEVGMGRGTFIYNMAKKYPQYNFVGIDVIPEVIYEAVMRMEKWGGVPQNLRFVWLNAEMIDDIFKEGEVDRVYLNFSDPWPKTRHAKRRLTHRNFINRYAKILRDNGSVEFKTDGKMFFEFSLNEFANLDWKLSDIYLDLYNNLPEDNVATEYETKFVNKELPIYKLVATKR